MTCKWFKNLQSVSTKRKGEGSFPSTLFLAPSCFDKLQGPGLTQARRKQATTAYRDTSSSCHCQTLLTRHWRQQRRSQQPSPPTEGCTTTMTSSPGTRAAPRSTAATRTTAADGAAMTRKSAKPSHAVLMSWTTMPKLRLCIVHSHPGVEAAWFACTSPTGL